jgi:hypothetical protein
MKDDKKLNLRDDNITSFWKTKPIKFIEWPIIPTNYFDHSNFPLLAAVKGNNVEIGDPSVPNEIPVKDDLFIINKEEDFQYYSKLISEKSKI